MQTRFPLRPQFSARYLVQLDSSVNSGDRDTLIVGFNKRMKASGQPAALESSLRNFNTVLLTTHDDYLDFSQTDFGQRQGRKAAMSDGAKQITMSVSRQGDALLPSKVNGHDLKELTADELVRLAELA